MSIKGISMPFRKGKTGLPASFEDDELIADSLRTIIMTPVGQRVMRPSFGCNAVLYVFSNVDEVMQAKVRQEVLRAIQANEPRVQVTKIATTVDDDIVYVDIEYLVNRNQNSTIIEIPRVGV
jgi:phage baseplate assembly protein W